MKMWDRYLVKLLFIFWHYSLILKWVLYMYARKLNSGSKCSYKSSDHRGKIQHAKKFKCQNYDMNMCVWWGNPSMMKRLIFQIWKMEFSNIHLIPDFLYQQILLFLKSDSFTKYEFIRSKYTNEVVHLIDVL